MFVRRLAQETSDHFDGIMAKVSAIYPGSSPSKISKLVEDARKFGAKPWNQKVKREGKMAFVTKLLVGGGLTKSQIVEMYRQKYKDVSEKTAKATVMWTATKLGNKSKHVKEPRANATGKNTESVGTTDASPLAAWLTKARIAKGLSVPDLAQHSGLTPPAIYRIESGVTRNLREATQKKLEVALGSKLPADAAQEVRQEAQIVGLGAFEDFDPHLDQERPTGPGIYVLYDISERPIYVGEGSNVRKRIADHEEKFWFKRPIVESASWIRIDDATLRQQIEALLIKFLKSNAIINKQHVERTA